MSEFLKPPANLTVVREENALKRNREKQGEQRMIQCDQTMNTQNTRRKARSTFRSNCEQFTPAQFHFPVWKCFGDMSEERVKPFAMFASFAFTNDSRFGPLLKVPSERPCPVLCNLLSQICRLLLPTLLLQFHSSFLNFFS